MAPKAKSSSSGSILKQGTLSFASAKRGSTAAGKANTVKASPSITSVKPPGGEKREPGSRTASLDSTISINTTTADATSDDDVVLVSTASAQRAMKRRKTENGSAKTISRGIQRKGLANESDSSSDEKPADLGVLEKSPRVTRLYNQARLRMGEVPPIHAEKQTKVHYILRIFDTSYEFGPCVGMTRLERWELAHDLGLNPPAVIREILMTEQASKDDTYRQCVFYDDV